MEIEHPSLFPIEEETFDHEPNQSQSLSRSFDSLDIMQLKSELMELTHWQEHIGLPSIENEKKLTTLNSELERINEDLKLQIETHKCEIESNKITIKTYEDENRKWLKEKEEMQTQMEYLTQKSADEMKHLSVLSVHQHGIPVENNELFIELHSENENLKFQMQTLKTEMSKFETDLLETEKQNIKYEKSLNNMHLNEEQLNNRIAELVSELIFNKNELEICKNKIESMNNETQKMINNNMQLTSQMHEIDEINNKTSLNHNHHHRRISSHTIKVNCHPKNRTSTVFDSADVFDHVIIAPPPNPPQPPPGGNMCHSRNVSMASHYSHGTARDSRRSSRNFGLNPTIVLRESNPCPASPTASLQTVRETGLDRGCLSSDREESEYTVDDEDEDDAVGGAYERHRLNLVNMTSGEMEQRMKEEMEIMKENVELHYSKLMRKQKQDLMYENQQNSMIWMQEIEQLKNEVMRLKRNKKSKKYKKMQKLEKKMMKHAKMNDAKNGKKCDFWNYPWCYSVAK